MRFKDIKIFVKGHNYLVSLICFLVDITSLNAFLISSLEVFVKSNSIDLSSEKLMNSILGIASNVKGNKRAIKPLKDAK